MTFKSNLFFCSFATTDLDLSVKRLNKQAKEINAYKNIKIFRPKDFKKRLNNKIKKLLKNGNKKGYGYWTWKPEIIKYMFTQMKNNDTLHYSDIGNHINNRGSERLKFYLKKLKSNRLGILAFEYKKPKKTKFKFLEYLEKDYTKADLFKYFNVLNKKGITHTPQVWAGNFFIRKSKKTELLLNNWIEIQDKNFNLLNDSKSIINNFHNFIEHRHDQSVFSILCKLKKAYLLSAYECEYAFKRNGQRTWEHLELSPVLAKRDLKRNIFKRFYIRQTKNLKRKIRYFSALKKSY